MSDSMLDQATRRVDIRSIVDSVDSLVAEAVAARSDTEIASVASGIRFGMQSRGVTLAKLLYEWEAHCPYFGIPADDWVDHVMATTGLSKQTISKYTAVWETIFENPRVPEEIKDELAAKPMQGLLLLSAAAREGQLSEEEWGEVVEAPDTLTIRNVVRKVRGEKTTSSTAVVLTWRRDGTIQARRGEEYTMVGYLKKPVTELEKIAVERVLRAAGILEE